MTKKKLNNFQWFLEDLDGIPKNNLKVFSTFSGVGGSTLGYKKAGFDVIGCNDTDPRMMAVYEKNLRPKYAFLCPIKNLLQTTLPESFYNLDILDGSPPCSAFSAAQGKREQSWGKLKKFREGQTEQVLTHLFFDFLNLAEKLQPKVIVAENVQGLVSGSAKCFAKEIFKTFTKIGYSVQLFLTNGADCGLPQMRPRVFFVARKKSLMWPDLNFHPKEKHVSVKEAFQGLDGQCIEKETRVTSKKMKLLWENTPIGKSFSGATKKFFNKGSFFNYYRNNWNRPSFTLTATPTNSYHPLHFRTHSTTELKILFDFPNDFSFETDKNPNFSYPFTGYGLGMSVPPKMIECLSKEILKQWF